MARHGIHLDGERAPHSRDEHAVAHTVCAPCLLGSRREDGCKALGVLLRRAGDGRDPLDRLTRGRGIDRVGKYCLGGPCDRLANEICVRPAGLLAVGARGLGAQQELGESAGPLHVRGTRLVVVAEVHNGPRGQIVGALGHVQDCAASELPGTAALRHRPSDCGSGELKRSRGGPQELPIRRASPAVGLHACHRHTSQVLRACHPEGARSHRLRRDQHLLGRSRGLVKG